jgi:TRAP-type C4-dicarboxylate transport system permease small subunit
MQQHLSPKPWISAILRVESGLCTVINWACTFILLAMLATMVWQVTCRFVLKMFVPWTDELSRYLFISITYVGAGAALSQNAHVEISLITSILKGVQNEKRKLFLAKLDDIIRYAAMFFLSVVLFKLTWPYTWQVKAVGQVSAAMHMPTWILDAILVFGLFSMAFHSLLRIILCIGDHSEIIDPMIMKNSVQQEEKS